MLLTIQKSFGVFGMDYKILDLFSSFPYTFKDIYHFLQKNDNITKYRSDPSDKNGIEWNYYYDLRTDGSKNTFAHASSRSLEKPFYWTKLVLKDLPLLPEWSNQIPYKKMNTVFLIHISNQVAAHSDLDDLRISQQDKNIYFKKNKGSDFQSIKIILKGSPFHIGKSITPKVNEKDSPLIIGLSDWVKHWYENIEPLCIISFTGYLDHHKIGIKMK